MGHKQSKQSNKGSRQPKPRKLHPPKHMLWGCTTPEEHYAYIDDVCDRVKELKGEAGLKLMGFEYRTLHNPETCVCRDEMIVDDDEQVGLDVCDDDGERKDWEEEEEGGDEKHDEGDVVDDIGECYMVPIGMSLKEHERRSGSFMMESTMERLSSRSRDNREDNNTDDDGEGSNCSPNSIRLGARSLSSRDENDPSSPFSSSSPSNRLSKRQRPVSRATSNVSLFSLATHNSSDISQTEDEECALRLYHVPSGSTLISSQNHQTYIAGGRMYDEVCRLCMEYAQDVMIEEGNLNWVSVCNERNIQALVSRNQTEECHSESNNNQSQKRKKKVLLIITGKGKVRAGIFSRRHLVTTGAEAATAIPLVREAKRRDMDIVIIDPNARGDKLGMDTVTTSLEHLFLRRRQTVDDNSDDVNKDEEEKDIYVLAHSMAGAQLVRFLHDTSSTSTKASAAASSSSKDNTAQETKAVTTTRTESASSSSFLRKIKAIAFTDSNHSIQWTRKTNPKLTNLLVGPKCLYVKSHKLHDDERKYPGEAHHECQFWHHRFGTIRTIWAGTHEHSLTNHTARFHIWDHFDSFGSSYF